MEHSKTSKWIKVDWDSVNTRRDETVHGIKVKMFASPYDVPEALRTVLDEDKKKLVIEFRYLNEEPTEEKRHNAYITYGLGKFSKCLYSLSFDINSLTVENRKGKFTKYDKIVGVINQLLKESKQTAPLDNYELARDAVKAKYEMLLAAA